MGESEINAALRHFEAAEANLEKLERVLTEINALIPDGIVFGNNADYEAKSWAYRDILDALPRIDGWKPISSPLDLNTIAQTRLDGAEIGEIQVAIDLQEQIDEPARELAQYRHRLYQKRRKLIRDALTDVIGAVDAILRGITAATSPAEIEALDWERVESHAQEIETLLGKALPRPTRWPDFRRHLRFGQPGDHADILLKDWPSVRQGLTRDAFALDEPIPVGVDDLGAVAETRPRGQVATKLNWSRLSDEDFERLIYALITMSDGYENAEWLTKTRAPDRGRDLSVYRVTRDALAGTHRRRVIIQCKHWLQKSIDLGEVVLLRGQMALWEPRVDVLVICTTGRFTSDAVASVEGHNNSDTALQVEMWPESHLERLLAQRPALIAEFSLR